MDLGFRNAAPGGKNPSSRERRSGDEGGGADLDQELCYHVTVRMEAELYVLIEAQRATYIGQEETPKP